MLVSVHHTACSITKASDTVERHPNPRKTANVITYFPVQVGKSSTEAHKARLCIHLQRACTAVKRSSGSGSWEKRPVPNRILCESSPSWTALSVWSWYPYLAIMPYKRISCYHEFYTAVAHCTAFLKFCLSWLSCPLAWLKEIARQVETKPLWGQLPLSAGGRRRLLITY